MTVTAPHTAQLHRVRIFVVPDAALQGDPPPVGDGHAVTDRHLEAARTYVMRRAPELADDVQAIIVIGDKAATFLSGRLVPHDAAIQHAAIRMFTESDVIEWQSDAPFEIVSTEKVDKPIWSKGGSPDNPFYEGPPFDGGGCGQDAIYRARSSKTKDAANGQQYKVTIKIGNRLVDPDYVCGNPPPGN
jgi:hypothetical protein